MELNPYEAPKEPGGPRWPDYEPLPLWRIVFDVVLVIIVAGWIYALFLPAGGA